MRHTTALSGKAGAWKIDVAVSFQTRLHAYKCVYLSLESDGLRHRDGHCSNTPSHACSPLSSIWREKEMRKHGSEYRVAAGGMYACLNACALGCYRLVRTIQESVFPANGLMYSYAITPHVMSRVWRVQLVIHPEKTKTHVRRACSLMKGQMPLPGSNHCAH